MGRVYYWSSLQINDQVISPLNITRKVRCQIKGASLGIDRLAVKVSGRCRQKWGGKKKPAQGWLSRAIGRTSQFWHFCHCILFAPPPPRACIWCPRKERKYRALLSEEVFPCAAGWPGSAEEQNICHSSIEFRLGDIHQWIIPVLSKEEKYMKVQIPSKIKYSHVWLLKSASAHWIYKSGHLDHCIRSS